MPSSTPRMARTMAAAAHGPAFARRMHIPQNVARDFNKADTGTPLLSQAMRGRDIGGAVDPESLSQQYAIGGGLHIRMPGGVHIGMPHVGGGLHMPHIGGGMHAAGPHLPKLQAGGITVPFFERAAAYGINRYDNTANRPAAAQLPDVPDATGQDAGRDALSQMLRTGPYGVPVPGFRVRPTIPRPPRAIEPGTTRTTYEPRFHAGGEVHPGGLVAAAGPGRTDLYDINVRPGSYVLPADTVSGLVLGRHKAESNTIAGAHVLNAVFAKGNGHQYAGRVGLGQPIAIQVAGGEYIVNPEHVAAIGGGDLDRGHKILDRLVRTVRKKNIETLKALPRPKHSHEK